ncbi:MAG: hypothetical protein CMK32_08275 [Porticoccaceae bacterium]|nr:hypothetical protein [Porticoccaceae bacterium]
MSRTIKIVGPEGHGVTIQTINDKLQERFLGIRERNPKGFLDQFDQQFEVICCDIAQEIGAEFTIVDDVDSFGNPCDGLVFAVKCSIKTALEVGE